MTEKTPELTEEEKEIISQIRTVGFGKVVVTVKNGKPVYVETQKTIPLSNRQQAGCEAGTIGKTEVQKQ